ncbi:MAG: cation:proton antiporter [Deltaproteobacteria bacterium]|nr:cation:proton antiporter [Deltaproteobacteria bacterium]
MFWPTLLEILLLLGLAFVVGACMERLGLSAVVGYLIAGVIAGPWLFAENVVRDLSELGVSLLLFSIGLEFSLARLRSLGKIAFGGGAAQVAATLAVFAVPIAVFRGTGEAVALGAMAALSSTAVVLRTLADRAELDSVRGRASLGILLFQDIAVVPLVLLITIMTEGGGWLDVAKTIGRTVASAAALAGAFWVLFNHVVPLLFRRREVTKNRELVILLAIVSAAGSIWAAHAVGLSPALGAFLAGMLLAESPFATQIRADVGTMRTVFVTLFFTSIGMLADPRWVIDHWTWVLPGLAGVLVGKTLVVFLVCRLFRMDTRDALATGITLAQIGEFSFVLATIANAGGLIDDDLFAFAVSVTMLSLFFGPVMVGAAQGMTDRTLGWIADRRGTSFITPELTRKIELRSVLVVGYGPAGRAVARALVERGERTVVLEQNPASAKIARHDGLAVKVGNAAQPEILEHAGARTAWCVVVTLPDTKTATAVIGAVRALAPDAIIVARARYNLLKRDLVNAGADIIVDEEEEVGERLALTALAQIGKPSA